MENEVEDNLTENLTAAIALEQEKSAETALRPKKLSEFTGQVQVCKQLQLILDAGKSRGESPDHILFAGPPGLGKTTLSMIVANEMGTNIRITSGPSITHAGDLAAILSSLQENEVLFIDEIHRLAKPAQELLYIAMEDFRVDVVVGKGVGASSIPLPLPRFTCIGATTRTGLLPAPLRDRFGFLGQMDFYTPEELTRIVLLSAGKLGIRIDEMAAEEIARRSRGTARIANRLLRRARDYADIHANGKLDEKAAKSALDLFEIDSLGLDRLDRQVLEAVVLRFCGGPVGVKALASSVGEESETIESVSEPFLVRQGFLTRTPRGRVATEKTKEMFS